MGKLTTLIALGAGYVLGTRAGRERYEQIKQTAVTTAQRPEVQQARDRLKSVAGDKLQAGVARVKQTAGGEGSSSSSSAGGSSYPSAASETVVVEDPTPGIVLTPVDPPEPFPADPAVGLGDGQRAPGTDPLP